VPEYAKCPECGDRFDREEGYKCSDCGQLFCDDFCLDDHKCPAEEKKEEKAEGEEKKPIATIKGGKTKSGEEED